jgi:DNA-binding LytR/AlgR family response regulator
MLKLKEQHHVVQIEWKGRLDTLKVCDIVYLSSELRYVRVHTTNNEFTCIGKLDDYENRLANYGFLRCHQSYLINMKFIESIKNKVITTTVGKEIDISARKKQDFLDAYNDYIAKYRV